MGLFSIGAKTLLSIKNITFLQAMVVPYYKNINLVVDE